MVRLTHEHLEINLVALSILHHLLRGTGLDERTINGKITDVYSAVTGRRYSCSITNMMAKDLPDSESFPVTVQDMIDFYYRLMRQKRDGDQDIDLIDTICNAFGMPYLQNRLGVKTLKTLRRKLVLPEELTSLRETLEKGFVCASCKRELESGEMMTYMRNGDFSEVICQSCCYATSIACTCGKAKPIDDILARRVRKTVKCNCTQEHPEAQLGAAEEVRIEPEPFR